MKRLAALWIAAAVLAGCQAVSDTYDRVFRGAAPQTAQKPAELVELQPKAAPKVIWQGGAGSAEKDVFYPEVSGSIVYAAGASGRVSGFEARSGKAVAQIDAGQRISGGVGAGAGLVFVGTSKGEVLAFDRDGKQAWKAQLGGQVLAPPAAQDGTVVARAGDGNIYGLDAASGKRKWIYQRATPALSLRTHAGVVLHRGGVFAGFPGGNLVALSLQTGGVGWEAAVAVPRGATELERVADITSLPVVDGQQVCAAAYQGRVACFDIARGTTLWSREVSSLSGIGVETRYLYVTDVKSAVLAFDKANGANIWRQDKLAGRGVSTPLAFGRYAVVGDYQGYVHLLAREDGSFAARIATDGSPIIAPPVALDLTSFLVQTRNGGVFAITVQ